MISSTALRTAFLEYFASHNHEIVPSSPLVPYNDPTLTFTNAGMVQFKDAFLGRERRNNPRACSSQRCVRAGGKHNDLENVGYTARHHTFFEMLGNFSFGDYFKREAIHYAWEFLTKKLGFLPEKLWITVYINDDEAANIWLKEIGINPAQFSRIGDKPNGKRHESDNFWSMGNTGPCGPCSEIFYDHGPEIPGGPPGTKNEDGDRYIEIWNLVFMQYNRNSDGHLTPLPHTAVDTGMGLERLAAIMQGVHDNYEIDLFQELIRATATLTNTDNLRHKSLRVIADHIRASTFLVTDGVTPSNEGRGYVLRRIIRRAIRHGYQLKAQTPFFYKLVKPLIAQMGVAFPELITAQTNVENTLKIEEERFSDTLVQGMRIFNQTAANLSGQIIPGETIFKLYDTYGFPTDLTADIAREHGLHLDLDGFERAMDAQRTRARAASQFGVSQTPNIDMEGQTDFTGYQHLIEKATILAIFSDGNSKDSLEPNQEGMIILDRTPFYAESGGQVGDQGIITTDTAEFKVLDTKKQGNMVIGHLGQVHHGILQVGDLVEAIVDTDLRLATALNHSATHLLHAALRNILGDHVTQKGSLVNAERLRFDFAHPTPVTPEQLRAMEQLVNQEIRANHLVETRIMSLEDAKAMGAMALFGEKYTNQVRVLCIGNFSTELCGGTHVNAVGNIGLFKIIQETGIAAGVRRIEAATGAKAVELMTQDAASLHQIATLIRSNKDDLPQKISQYVAQMQSLEKELQQLKIKMANNASSDLLDQVQEIAGIKVLAAKLETGTDLKTLPTTLDNLKSRLSPAIIVLAVIADNKVNLIVGITKDITNKAKAGDLIKLLAEPVGAKGGGRPDMARAGGGTNIKALPEALSLVIPWVKQRFSDANSTL